nr:nucleoside recognition domain-containing protein [Sedimentibacter sp.]
MNYIMDMFINLLSFTWNITRVIIPLMLIMEIFKDLKIIDKISNFIKPATNFLTIEENSGISLVIGIIFGLLFGAGAMIQNTKEHDIDKRSIFLICMFLSLCHAVIEDTFIFGAIGANFAIILGSRIIAAILTTLVLSKMIKKDISDPSKL